MKNFKNFLLLGLVAISTTTLVSCEKDPLSAPTVALVSPSAKAVTVAPNETVNVEVLAAAADAKLNRFRVEFSQNGGQFTAYTAAFPAGKNDTTFSEQNFRYKKELGTLAAAGTIVYRFIATDKDAKEASLDFTITVAEAGATINTYSAVLLGGQSNATNGSFIATSNGTVYNQANAKANANLVDVLYYYGANNQATLAAPSNSDAGSVYNNATTGLQTWSKRNATVLASTSLTEADFNGISSSSNIETQYALVIPAPSASDAKQLGSKNVLAFKTEAGKKGFILVSAISGTQTGSITITVKVQK